MNFHGVNVIAWVYYQLKPLGIWTFILYWYFSRDPAAFVLCHVTPQLCFHIVLIIIFAKCLFFIPGRDIVEEIHNFRVIQWLLSLMICSKSLSLTHSWSIVVSYDMHERLNMLKQFLPWHNIIHDLYNRVHD